MTTTRLVFYNPSSGSAWIGRRIAAAVRALQAVPGTEAVATERGNVPAQVRARLTKEITRAYAIGGDGTIGDVAGALVGTEVALGIIPTGTTNVLAREYGISLWTQRAVRQLEASTTTRPLRTWKVGEHTAVLGGGVGWDARVMFRSPTAMKRRMGRTGIALVGFREMARYEFPKLVVRGTDDQGRDVTLRGTSVILATVKRWAGGNTGIPQADPSDEYLDVVVLEPDSLLHLMAFWALMMLPGGRPLTLPRVRSVRMTRVLVESEDDHEVEAHVNGEGVAWTPVIFEPNGVVNVLVP